MITQTICTFCLRPLGSLVTHNGRPRVLVETYVREPDGEVYPACQLCEVEKVPANAKLANDLERDAAARAREEWRSRNPPTKLGSRTHVSPGRPIVKDNFTLKRLPSAGREKLSAERGKNGQAAAAQGSAKRTRQPSGRRVNNGRRKPVTP